MVHNKPTIIFIAILALFSCLAAKAAPGDILYENQFGNNGEVTASWTRTAGAGNDFQASNTRFNSGPRSLRIRDEAEGEMLPNLIAAAVPAAELSLWVQQDFGGNQPENNEDLELYYFNDLGSWILLTTYLGSDPAGTIITDTIPLPTDALHADLRFRFIMTNGSNADRWYVDDFTVTEVAPAELNPPTAVDDTATVLNGFSINIDLAANDTDAESGINLASITIGTGPSNGIVVVNADGTVDYTHNGSATTSDSFTYTIRDNAGNTSNIATVTISVANLVCDTYADNFDAGTIGNNTGTINFSNDWNFRSVADGTGLGFAQLNNNRLQLQGNNDSDASISDPYDYDNNWAQRDFSLAGFNVATLNFDFIAVGGLEVEDEALVEISNDGGASFTVLQIFNGFTSTTTVPVSIDISAFIVATPDIRVRFRIQEDDNSTPCCFGATGELVEIDNLEIEACTASTVDRYAISAISPTVTCEQSAVTITARDSSGGAIDIPAGTTLTLSTDIANDGWTNPIGAFSNQYTLPADSASETFQLRRFTPATLEIDVDDNNGVTDDDGNRDDDFVIFNDVGFRFYGDGVVDSVGDQIAGKPSNVAPDSQVVTIRAIQTNPATGRCDALINNASADIDFSYSCIDPASCAINNNGMSINGSQTIDDAAVGNTTVNILFDATGTGTLNFAYFDVGQIQINASANLDVGGAGTALVVGPSNIITLSPFAYDIQIAGDPNASTGTDAVYGVAGTAFNTLVRSVIWQAADDSDNDGIADAGADLSDNNVTPNIVNISGNIGLTPSAQVVTNSDGALTTNSINFSSFDAVGSAGEGTFSFNQAWSEVGILTIDALTNNFMGSGRNVSGVRTNIGRFTPASFALSPPAIVNQCGTFTYGGFFDGVNPGLDRSGQSFDVSGTITALNALGIQTLNYAGVFAKLVGSDITAQPFDTIAAANDSGRVNFTSSVLNFINGVSNYGDTTADYQFDVLAGPKTLRLDLLATDSDLVSSGTINSNNFETRIGRMLLIDTYGPELIDLEMRLRAEYFDGTAWVRNTDDSCSAYIQTDASFDVTSYTDNLNDGETTIFSPATSQTLVNGVSNIANGIWFTAPGNNNYGSVNINLDLTAQPWLQFDYDADNSIDTTTATLNFGYYRGNDRMIYWREL